MISFEGAHYPKEVILYAVFFYVRYTVSYRDLEDILTERGVKVDHAILNRWVISYSPALEVEAKKHKRTVAAFWHLDETYIKGKGYTDTVLLINLAIPLILCFPSIGRKRLLPLSSSKRSIVTDCHDIFEIEIAVGHAISHLEKYCVENDILGEMHTFKIDHQRSFAKTKSGALSLNR